MPDTSTPADTQSEAPKTLMIDSLDEFVFHLVNWHKRKIATLRHMAAIPEGVEVTFNSDPPTTLQGDMHKGFLMGLSVALHEVGTLPFEAEVVTTSDADQQPLPSAEAGVVEGSTNTH